ncbi:uncharacterized protein BXZ73DRAFT_107022 [Epithele typhae]|uniref:uncharacterized protein n=1 Tax=Epithele typhae TaxID=378194 RepID=UPI002007F564|nr:uncharacterized protein BXZ73DRAFT_107022 [Epithele typhae]KAH9913145.1 hypothetical protein BXZ73DRAFT_107022 [Epithele typhae]
MSPSNKKGKKKAKFAAAIAREDSPPPPPAAFDDYGEPIPTHDLGVDEERRLAEEYYADPAGYDTAHGTSDHPSLFEHIDDLPLLLDDFQDQFDEAVLLNRHIKDRFDTDGSLPTFQHDDGFLELPELLRLSSQIAQHCFKGTSTLQAYVNAARDFDLPAPALTSILSLNGPSILAVGYVAQFIQEILPSLVASLTPPPPVPAPAPRTDAATSPPPSPPCPLPHADVPMTDTPAPARVPPPTLDPTAAPSLPHTPHGTPLHRAASP